MRGTRLLTRLRGFMKFPANVGETADTHETGLFGFEQAIHTVPISLQESFEPGDEFT